MKPFIVAAAAAVLLSGCASASQQVAAPSAFAAAPKPWGWGYSAKARAEMAATFGAVALKPAEYRWVADVPTSGETRVVVSLSDQLAWIYRGERMIGVTTISSGNTNHETPVGLFPIMAKKAFHRSNRYSNAPMPHMLRLNRWGVAIHGGVVPGYPASHGCIRMPLAFAKKLFGYVANGDNVYVEG